MPTPDATTEYLTGDQVAALLGVSRRTLYRWHHEGRLATWEWTIEQIAARRAELRPRPRGPQRDPRSLRYTVGRHRFDEMRCSASASKPGVAVVAATPGCAPFGRALSWADDPAARKERG